MLKQFVMGIDGGTEGVRVGVFDLAGNPLAYATEAYATTYPRPGWAAQNPGEWEAALVKAVGAALRQPSAEGWRVIGVSADATIGTLVFLDEAGRSLCDAILWMDVRAAAQFDRMMAGGHPALALNPTAEWPIPKLMWVKENEPEIYRKTRTVLEYTSWLAWRMTGRRVVSYSNTASRWLANRAKGGYPLDLYASLGLDDLLGKLPAETRFLDDTAGTVTREFAEATGLPAGIPVAVGSPDGIAAMVGLNAIRPGQPVMICGTSHVHVFMSEIELHAKGIIGSYPDGIKPGVHILEGGQVSTGAVLKWFRDGFLGSYASRAAAEGIGAYELLDRLAADLPIGADGLVMLEYFQGNRTPYQDPYARGALWGLSLRHTPVHVYRAILEGVAFGTRRIFDAMRAGGVGIDTVIACGGMTKSDLWLKIHADACNVPIAITDVQEASVLGSAIIAARVAGAYPSLDAAAAGMVRQKRVIEPDAEAFRRYTSFYDLYAATYPALKDLMRKMSALTEG